MLLVAESEDRLVVKNHSLGPTRSMTTLEAHANAFKKGNKQNRGKAFAQKGGKDRKQVFFQEKAYDLGKGEIQEGTSRW